MRFYGVYPTTGTWAGPTNESRSSRSRALLLAAGGNHPAGGLGKRRLPRTGGQNGQAGRQTGHRRAKEGREEGREKNRLLHGWQTVEGRVPVAGRSNRQGSNGDQQADRDVHVPRPGQE